MFPEDAVQAFFHSYTYSRYKTLKAGTVPVFPEAAEAKARKYLEPSGVLKNGGWLPPETALGLLREYGIPAAETRTAFSAEEAAKAALEIGFPVVMKLRSTTITHKTDVHGVLLGLQSEDEVIQGYKEMKTRLEAAGQGKADGRRYPAASGEGRRGDHSWNVPRSCFRSSRHGRPRRDTG